jgi:septal ring factor EnvC (AmiA/AmiB activator)
MASIDFIERKLEELTRKVNAFEQENAALKRDIGILEESIEALTGHGIDVDGQLAEVYGRIRDLENSQSAKQDKPTLTLLQRRFLDACDTS